MSDSPPKSRAISLEAQLPATPEEVSRMVSDPAELARWFAPYVDGSGRAGDVLTFRWTPEQLWRSKVEIVEPGRLVRWRDPPSEAQPGGPPGPMVLEWTFTAEAGGTRLRLVHSGFGEAASWDDQYDATVAGWSFFLWHLGETLRHHRGERRDVVWERRNSPLAREVLGAKVFGTSGLALEPERPPAGSTAHLRLAGARLPFEVQHSRWPTHLWGKLPGLNGAVLLVEMEPGEPVNTGFWLSTWGLDERRRGEVQAALRAMADTVFGSAAP